LSQHAMLNEPDRYIQRNIKTVGFDENKRISTIII